VSKQCWCGSRRAASRCCGPYLDGSAIAPTAVALMRSRYSAFCTGNVDYLLATHHPSTRDPQKDDERERLTRSVDSTQWTNLLVIKTQKGQKNDKTGRVEFVAAYQSKPSPSVDMTVPSRTNTAKSRVQAPDQSSNQAPSAAAQLHENSRFVREKGQWFYLDGDMLPSYQPKRSHACWCGSGKPYKHCHFPH